MSEQLFPDRVRCKKCRRNLGESVLLGLYCSAVCADMAQPRSLPQEAPRQCRTQRDGAWVFKQRYRSIGELPRAVRDQPSTSWYWCTHCGHLHVGRTQVRTDEQMRMFQDPLIDLPDLLVKLRGQATQRQVAQVAGVRPIRLKELEEGIGHPQGLETLSKVLKAYRVRLGVALPAQGHRS